MPILSPIQQVAKVGDVAELTRLHRSGSTLDSTVCDIAVINGHLDCIKYAHEHGCPFSRNIVSYAAMYGHLDCLQYVWEHGGTHTNSHQLIMHCAMGGSLECLRFLFDKGVEMRTNDILVLQSIVNQEKCFDCFAFLYHHIAEKNPETIKEFWRTVNVHATTFNKIDFDDSRWRKVLFDEELISIIQAKKQEVMFI